MGDDVELAFVQRVRAIPQAHGLSLGLGELARLRDEARPPRVLLLTPRPAELVNRPSVDHFQAHALQEAVLALFTGTEDDLQLEVAHHSCLITVSGNGARTF